MDINGYKWTIFVKKSRKKPSTQFCIFMHFAPHFSDIFKEPNLRFESAHLTSSKRLFDELIKAL